MSESELPDGRHEVGYAERPTFHGQPYDPAHYEWARGPAVAPHLVESFADMVRRSGGQPDLRRLGAATVLCDEVVAGDGDGTGMLDYPRALPPPLLFLLAGWCVGITETRPPNQAIGRKGSPYIDRWFLGRKIAVPEFSAAPDYRDVPPLMASEIENIYLHDYHRGDADEPHDHPWPNASLVVRGWYREAIYTMGGRLLGDVVRRPGDLVLRRARSIHAILETGDNCLSLFATLQKERDWGFHTAAGFVPWREFDRQKEEG